MWVRGNDDGKFAVVSDNTEAFRLHSYSGLNLNQYSVASPCRTACTVCGFVALS